MNKKITQQERFVEDLATFVWMGNHARHKSACICLQHKLQRKLKVTNRDLVSPSSLEQKKLNSRSKVDFVDHHLPLRYLSSSASSCVYGLLAHSSCVDVLRAAQRTATRARAEARRSLSAGLAEATARATIQCSTHSPPREAEPAPPPQCFSVWPSRCPISKQRFSSFDRYLLILSCEHTVHRLVSSQLPSVRPIERSLSCFSPAFAHTHTYTGACTRRTHATRNIAVGGGERLAARGAAPRGLSPVHLLPRPGLHSRRGHRRRVLLRIRVFLVLGFLALADCLLGGVLAPPRLGRICDLLLLVVVVVCGSFAPGLRSGRWTAAAAARSLAAEAPRCRRARVEEFRLGRGGLNARMCARGPLPFLSVPAPLPPQPALSACFVLF